MNVHYSYLFSGTNAVSATLQMRTEHSAILLCKLACSSPDLTCVLTDFSMNETDYVDIGNISYSEKDYEHPYQPINISNLASGTTYHFCVFANNTAMNRLVGKQHCGSFTTMPSESGSKYIGDYCINFCSKLLVVISKICDKPHSIVLINIVGI